MHTEKQTTPLNYVWYKTKTVTLQAHSIGDNYAEPFYRTGWVDLDAYGRYIFTDIEEARECARRCRM